MIVRQFLHWVRTAPAGERAEATGALARAYLYSDLSKEDRAAAQGAMIMLLDDPSPLVRRALAEALAGSADAPHAVIHALASDHADTAALVLARSPLLIDAELVDVIASGGSELQTAIASRVPLQSAVAAALAEAGSVEACLVALENPHAAFAPASFDRLVTRFGRIGTVREAMFARADLPMAARHALMGMLSSLLADFVVDREWLTRGRADQVIREARDRGTVTIAALGPDPDTRPLVRHLRASGQLTAGLVLRALLSGQVAMFEEVLAELSGLPLARVRPSSMPAGPLDSAPSTRRRGCLLRCFRRSAKRSRRCTKPRARTPRRADSSGRWWSTCSPNASTPISATSSRCSSCSAATPPRPRARMHGPIAKSSSPMSAWRIAPLRERRVVRQACVRRCSIVVSRSPAFNLS
jgi:uncharacterized protein (DUF2336 family)